MSNVEKFGKYILLEKLAVGGMAEVYLAKSSGANGVNKFVAIKRILPQFSNNPDFVEMFKEEAKVAINLNHSNIVSIYDFGIEDGQFYLVMEFVDGRNLRQIINELKKHNKSFSIDQAVYLVKEAAAGLNHAHRCTDSLTGKPLNITHRDMSPQNIMISFDGETKVIDFGIAKAESENEGTKAGTLKGKFSYMSPEQAEGYPIDPRTDVFALGIILWELLANDRLFTGSNEGAILRKVRDCQIPSIRKINPMVPVELERIVTKALAKDKNVRYQTAANMHKDLNLFLNTQYPDFSIHDFSQFIKDYFKASYTEGREKLMHFSKLSLDEAKKKPEKEKIVEEKTNLKKSSAEKNEKSSIKKAKSGKKNSAEPETENVSKVSLDGVRNSSVIQYGADFKKSTSRDHAHGGTHHDERTNITQFKSPSYSSRRLVSHSSSADSNSSLFAKIGIFAVLVVLTITGFKTLLKEDSEKPAVTAETPTSKAKTRSTGSITEVQQLTKLSVVSTPSAARIFIDGEDTNQITPAIISVVANKKVKVSLIKNGYYKYELEKIFTEPSSMTTNLTPTPQMGYVNIHVVNGSQNTIISVNGQRIQEKPPVSQYAVPANVDIVIEASNPITNLKDRVKIKVLANKTQNVQLILGRVPASTKKK